MNEKQRLFWISCWVVITRIGDGVSTYLSTPDLYLEVNPLVTELGMGWTGLILAGLIFVAMVLWLLYYSHQHLSLFDIQTTSMTGYVLTFFCGEPKTGGGVTYCLPRIKSSLTYLGQVFPRVLIWYSLFLIVNNLISAAAHHYHMWYLFSGWFYYQSLYWDYTILTLLAIWFSLALFRWQYKAFN